MFRARVMPRFPLLIFLTMASLCSAAAFAQDFADRSDVAAFVRAVSRRHDMPETAVWDVLLQARAQPRIVATMTGVSASPVPWRIYRSRFVNPERIGAGLAFWKANAATLAAARERYGVPEEIIVATLGVETHYGKQQGGHRALDALATLAFDYPPRASFFRDQLEEFIVLTRELALDPAAVRGSYAGALGIPQFMPGSYRHFGVDFDGDGRIDLFANAADAIGSVARFYQAHGWQTDESVAVPAMLGGGDAGGLLEPGIQPTWPLERLLAGGVAPAVSLPPGIPAMLLALEGTAGTEYWVGLSNFYVITRYNRSVNYAMAVFQLGRELRALTDLATGLRAQGE